MTATTVLTKAAKMNINIKEPQAHLVASVVNHPNTEKHFISQAQPQLIKLYRSL